MRVSWSVPCGDFSPLPPPSIFLVVSSIEESCLILEESFQSHLTVLSTCPQQTPDKCLLRVLIHDGFFWVGGIYLLAFKNAWTMFLGTGWDP